MLAHFDFREGREDVSHLVLLTSPGRDTVQWLHSGGPDGGQWNEAWRRFQDDKPLATAEQMWAFAGELMSRFGVNGPLVPYYCD